MSTPVLYHPEKNLGFLAHGRTASISTRVLLLGRGFDAVNAHHSGMPEEIKELRPACFCTARNHWDAWASWWYKEGRRGLITLDFLNEFTAAHGRFFLKGEMWFFKRLYPWIDVLAFEEIEAEVGSWLESHGLTGGPLPHRNKSTGRKHYSEVHSPESRAWVEQTFADEIEKFGFTYGEKPEGSTL